MTLIRRVVFTGALIVCVATGASAQQETSDDTRTQYPAFLTDSYFAINVGRMGNLFSGDQLQPGFQAGSVDIPRLAVRVDLLGHHFSKHVSAQITYMRPARFVTYHDLNGDAASSYQVSTAFAGLTLVGDVPLNARVSAYGEGGLGITSRSGVAIKTAPARATAPRSA